MRFPGLAPWAGMRCPVGANRTTAFRSRVLAPKETTTHVGHPLLRPPIPTKVGVPTRCTQRMWDTHSFDHQSDACGTPTYSTDKSGCPRFINNKMSLQNAPILSDPVPGLAPWAGMRCPVGANRTTAFQSRVLAPKETYALHPTHVRRMWDTHSFDHQSRQKWVSQIQVFIVKKVLFL